MNFNKLFCFIVSRICQHFVHIAIVIAKQFAVSANNIYVKQVVHSKTHC